MAAGDRWLVATTVSVEADDEADAIEQARDLAGTVEGLGSGDLLVSDEPKAEPDPDNHLFRRG
jgi:hypothetical protein